MSSLFAGMGNRCKQRRTVKTGRLAMFAVRGMCSLTDRVIGGISRDHEPPAQQTRFTAVKRAVRVEKERTNEEITRRRNTFFL